MQQQEQTSQERKFNPNEHLIKIKSGKDSKDYLPVQWRIAWFRDVYPQGTIKTNLVQLDMDRDVQEEITVWENGKPKKVIKQDKGFVIFKAVVEDGIGGIATGTKSEKACSFPDFIEKAETGSIGRALAALGFGTQFTGDEFTIGDEGVGKFVDAPAAQLQTQPQEQAQVQQKAQTPVAPTVPTPVTKNVQSASSLENDPPINSGQVKALVQLSAKLGEAVKEQQFLQLTFKQAVNMINQLNGEIAAKNKKAS